MASSDKPGFNVYGMMVVLSFFMMLGACLLLNDVLAESWGFKLGGDPPKLQSWHITEYRDLNKNYSSNARYLDVRQKDLDEWKLARNDSGAPNGDNFPVKD